MKHLRAKENISFSPLLLSGIFYYYLGRDHFQLVEYRLFYFSRFFGKIKKLKNGLCKLFGKSWRRGKEEALKKRPPALQIGKSWKVFQCFKTFLDSSLHLISWNEVCEVWYYRGKSSWNDLFYSRTLSQVYLQLYLACIETNGIVLAITKSLYLEVHRRRCPCPQSWSKLKLPSKHVSTCLCHPKMDSVLGKSHAMLLFVTGYSKYNNFGILFT